MPSSVNVGSRCPRSSLIFSYSSDVRPCCRRVSGGKAEVMEVVMGNLYCRILQRGEEARFEGRRNPPAPMDGPAASKWGILLQRSSNRGNPRSQESLCRKFAVAVTDLRNPRAMTFTHRLTRSGVEADCAPRSACSLLLPKAATDWPLTRWAIFAMTALAPRSIGMRRCTGISERIGAEAGWRITTLVY